MEKESDHVEIVAQLRFLYESHPLIQKAADALEALSQRGVPSGPALIDFTGFTMNRIRETLVKLGIDPPVSEESLYFDLENKVLAMCRAVDQIYAAPPADTQPQGLEQPSDDRIKLPSTADEVIAFVGNNFNSIRTWDNHGEPYADKQDCTYSLSVHDLLSAFDELAHSQSTATPNPLLAASDSGSKTDVRATVGEGQSVHEWFELTYAQFLTLPRVIMDAMPMPWQHKMTALLNELDESWDWLPANQRSYLVKAYEVIEHPWDNDEGEEKIREFEIDEDLCNYRYPKIEHRRKVAAQSTVTPKKEKP